MVFHTKNPKIPAMHFNTRYICTQKSWFGGGMDATPCLKDNKEKKYFHNRLKKICDVHNNSYQRLKIPLKKNARSLNIGMAVAITLSEALRQNYNL